MGKKRTSDTARLITWAMGVTEAELVTMGETVAAIRSARFPHVAPKSARKPRADKGTTRTPPPTITNDSNT